MKNTWLFILIGLIGLIYGILIGKYEFFPYNLLKSIKDLSEEKSLVQNSQEDYKYSQNDLERLLTVTPNNIDSLRRELSFKIFGTYTLPELLPDTIYEVTDTSYNDLTDLKKIERFEINQNYGINSIGYYFHPKNPINRLIIYHQGHGGDYILGKETIDFFLKKGFTLYAFCMPLLGKNNQPTLYEKKLGFIHLSEHDRLKYLKNPIKYFISPIISIINYSEKKKYRDITMVGISGGGWTTTLTAAVDSRVNFSFPVAGTYPMFVRFKTPKKNYGDFEQTYQELYSRINYMDMYVLGAVGENRFQTQILNKYDPCCFDGDSYKEYENFISMNVQKFENGNFHVFSDSSHIEHKISEAALSKIFDEINSAPN